MCRPPSRRRCVGHSAACQTSSIAGAAVCRTSGGLGGVLHRSSRHGVHRRTRRFEIGWPPSTRHIGARGFTLATETATPMLSLAGFSADCRVTISDARFWGRFRGISLSARREQRAFWTAAPAASAIWEICRDLCCKVADCSGVLFSGTSAQSASETLAADRARRDNNDRRGSAAVAPWQTAGSHACRDLSGLAPPHADQERGWPAGPSGGWPGGREGGRAAGRLRGRSWMGLRCPSEIMERAAGRVVGTMGGTWGARRPCRPCHHTAHHVRAAIAR